MARNSLKQWRPKWVSVKMSLCHAFQSPKKDAFSLSVFSHFDFVCFFCFFFALSLVDSDLFKRKKQSFSVYLVKTVNRVHNLFIYFDKTQRKWKEKTRKKTNKTKKNYFNFNHYDETILLAVNSNYNRNMGGK